MEEFLMSCFFKTIGNIGRLTRLPNNSMIDWFSCFLVPYNGSFTLVSNTDTRNLYRLNPRLDKSPCDNRLNRVPNFVGIMFHPTFFRKVLCKFLLGAADMF